ncbi:hypothetical protein Hanom_Chr13g01222971 [Helianthus anomalus]
MNCIIITYESIMYIKTIHFSATWHNLNPLIATWHLLTPPLVHLGGKTSPLFIPFASLIRFCSYNTLSPTFKIETNPNSRYLPFCPLPVFFHLLSLLFFETINFFVRSAHTRIRGSIPWKLYGDFCNQRFLHSDILDGRLLAQ